MTKYIENPVLRGFNPDPAFTGAFVGLCCQDLSGQKQHADFGFFTYKENAEKKPVYQRC